MARTVTVRFSYRKLSPGFGNVPKRSSVQPPTVVLSASSRASSFQSSSSRKSESVMAPSSS